MRAIVQDRYGPPDVLRLEEVDAPTPAAGEVLVRVHAAALNPADWHLMRADPFFMRLIVGGLLRPKTRVLGADVAGTVEAVGGDVARFRPGDEVFGCLSESGFGAFAERVAAPESAFEHKPAGASFAEAASVPLAGETALHALRDRGRVRAGQDVLVVGASGGVGTLAVQLAKGFGARVTGVCSTRNVELVRGLGADDVLDYTREDYTRAGRRWDLILDAAGSRPVRESRRALADGGVYVMIGGPTRRLFDAIAHATPLRRGNGSVEILLSRHDAEDLAFLRDRMEAGELKPVIDRHYPLDEVPAAIRYLEEGHARGKVVIDVAAGGGGTRA